MNRINKQILFITMVVIFAAFWAVAALAETVLVQRPEVEIKQGKGAFFATIYKAVKGETLEVTAEENGWYKVKTPNGEGWVFGKALAEQTASFDPNAAISGPADSSDMDKTAGFKAARPAEEGAAAPAANKIVVNSLGMEFVEIPAGTFQMGSPDEEPGHRMNEDKHAVTISKNFYIQISEVTEAQWDKLMGYLPEGSSGDGNMPAANISWDMAQEFISKLNLLEGSDKYRLPTEAEWEYACRAGAETAYFFGDSPETAQDFAWYKDNSGGMAHAVKQKAPNPWGLFDMAGNVSEWCLDLYGQYDSLRDDVTDPAGPAFGSNRIVRGGNMTSDVKKLRSAARDEAGQDYQGPEIGFRVIRAF